MKEILTLTVKLLLICAVVTGLLAAVNYVTEPIIAENNQKKFELSMAEVLPDAGSFIPVSVQGFTPSESGVAVESIYSGQTGGYVVSAVCAEGYGGDIEVMVGITAEEKVSQVKIMSMSETPGLGAKAETPEFTNQYRGHLRGISVVKNGGTSDNQIAAISGATVTSKAVTKAVNAALEAAEFAARKGGK